MKLNRLFKVGREYVYVIVGAILMGISTSNFLLPNQLSTGGFAGISTVVYYLLKYPAGNVLIALNVPLLLIAFFRINKSLFFKSIVGTAVLSVAINVFEKLGVATTDRLLACIYGGIIMGVGTAIVLKSRRVNRWYGFACVCYKVI